MSYNLLLSYNMNYDEMVFLDAQLSYNNITLDIILLYLHVLYEAFESCPLGIRRKSVPISYKQ